MVEAGQKAPQFSLKNQHDETVKLNQFLGQKVVIFFYPEDDTPTCTVEACNLRDTYPALRKNGITLLGISPNAINDHQKFIAKFNLPYMLLADPTHVAIKKYDVWGEKNMYGNKYMGLKRTTFLIDEQGVVFHVIRRVLSKNHGEQILKCWGMV